MNFYLSEYACLKWLESPSVYHIKKDELYEVDEEAFEFLKTCETGCKTHNREFLEFCLEEGILTENKVDIKRPPVIKPPTPSLRYLELQITTACNLKCKHCYIAGKPVELPFDTINKVLKEFEELQGLRLLISGGEPILHSEFERLNSILPKFFFRRILFTNGILLTDDMLERLNVEELQISIDGLEKGHDSLRGKGTFKKTMKALELALQKGFDVSVATMIHRNNLDEFEEMETLFKSMGVKEWNVDIPCVTGRLKENQNLQLEPQEAAEFLKYGFGGGIHSSTEGFACGLHLMAVTAEGKAAKCTFFSEEPVGTILEGLRVCWQRIRPIRLEELKCDCEFLNICRGGCRYRAFLRDRDAFGKDLFRCAMYKEG